MPGVAKIVSNTPEKLLVPVRRSYGLVQLRVRANVL